MSANLSLYIQEGSVIVESPSYVFAQLTTANFMLLILTMVITSHILVINLIIIIMITSRLYCYFNCRSRSFKVTCAPYPRTVSGAANSLPFFFLSFYLPMYVRMPFDEQSNCPSPLGNDRGACASLSFVMHCCGSFNVAWSSLHTPAITFCLRFHHSCMLVGFTNVFV